MSLKAAIQASVDGAFNAIDDLKSDAVITSITSGVMDINTQKISENKSNDVVKIVPYEFSVKEKENVSVLEGDLNMLVKTNELTANPKTYKYFTWLTRTYTIVDYVLEPLSESIIIFHVRLSNG